MALEFNSTDNNYIRLTYSFPITYVYWTGSFILNSLPSALTPIVSVSSFAANRDSQVFVGLNADNKPSFNLYATTPGAWLTIAGADALQTGKIYNFSAAFSNTNKFELWLNGVLVASDNGHAYANIRKVNAPYYFSVGNRLENDDPAGYPSVNAKVWDIRIYDDYLSGAKHKAIFYGQGIDNILENLYLRYLMNEKPDGETATVASSVIDVSGQGNHGTPYSSPVYRAGPVRLTKIFSFPTPWIITERNRNILYDIFAYIERARNIVYDQILYLSRIRDILYDSEIALSREKSIVYDSILYLSRARNIVYDIFAYIERARNIVYDQVLYLSKTRNILYDLEIAVSKTRNIVYDIIKYLSKSRSILYDIGLLSWIEAHSRKQLLNLLRKFVYDSTNETSKIETLGSVNRRADSIVSGGTEIGLINTAQYWNKFLTDKTNLRKTATLQLGIGVENTIARAGVARAGITVANLTTLKPGSVISSGIYVPGAGQWYDILTGWGDDPLFEGSFTTLPIRDKFAGLFEKTIGTKETPQLYAAHNPADLTWHVLVDHGDLDSTVSTDNTDIDYTSWSEWKTDCTTADLLLKARFTGETIREALELIRDLSNSGINQAGNGKLKFFRFSAITTGPSVDIEYTQSNMSAIIPKTTSKHILNYLTVGYDYKTITDLVINGSMEADTSWTTLVSEAGQPGTNERSNEQVYKGTYSRKVGTAPLHSGIYQDITTVVGVEYKYRARVYVTVGSARLFVGSAVRTIGETAASTTFTLVADTITTFGVTSGIAGRLNSIWLKVNNTSGTAKMKCALYDSDTLNGVPIAKTQEVTIAAGGGVHWEEFIFQGRPEVTAATTYHLAVWTDDNLVIYYNTVVPGNYRWKAEAYGSWPDPLTYDDNASQREFACYALYVDSLFDMSDIADLAAWTELSVTFTAIATTTRLIIMTEGNTVATFYVDEVVNGWTGPEYWRGSYLKQNTISQTTYGKVPITMDGTIIWHANLASATSYADRRIDIFSEPLLSVIISSFLMGMGTEIGDYIKATNSFFGYSGTYFRVVRILDLNMATAAISFEAWLVDFAQYFYLDDGTYGLLDQANNPLY